MKVLHAAPSLSQSYGGPTQSLAGYVAAASARGFAVTVAGPAIPDREKSWVASRFAAATVVTFPSFGGGAFSASPSMVDWVKEHSRDFDIVHTHGLFNPISSLSARAAIRKGASVVIRPFGTLSRYTFEHRRSTLKRAWLAALERYNLTNAAGLHFTTEMERREAAWHGIEFGSRAYVVPPPLVDVARSPKKMSSDSEVVLFIGRLHPVKNIESLVRAWPLVKKTNARAELVIAGTGDPGYETQLKQLAMGEKSVSFKGFVDGAEKDDLFAHATVAVLPSLHENFGIAAAEALAAGIPVIVSPEVQLSSFVEEKALGVVTATDPSALAHAIIRVLSDDGLRADVASRGAVEIDKHFSPRAIGAQLEAMYRSASAEGAHQSNKIRKQAS
jgi:glycosyltransferase involved in cell wall biosynthesis